MNWIKHFQHLWTTQISCAKSAGPTPPPWPLWSPLASEDQFIIHPFPDIQKSLPARISCFEVEFDDSICVGLGRSAEHPLTFWVAPQMLLQPVNNQFNFNYWSRASRSHPFGGHQLWHRQYCAFLNSGALFPGQYIQRLLEMSQWVILAIGVVQQTSHLCLIYPSGFKVIKVTLGSLKQSIGILFSKICLKVCYSFVHTLFNNWKLSICHHQVLN